MKQSLFELTKQQIEILELVENSETLDGGIDEFAEAALIINREEYVEKAHNYIAVIKEKEFNIQRGKEAKKQIDEYIKSNERVVTKLKEKLEDATKLFGPTEVGFHKLGLRKSDETIINDLQKLPEEFLNRKVVVTPDKAKIKKAIKSGEEVPGAELMIKQNLQIK